MQKSILFVLVIIFLFTSSIVVSADTKPLRFGIFPYKSSKSLVELFIPIAKRIEKEIGCKVNIVTAPSYDAYMSRVNALDYDIIMPCTACYMTLKEDNAPYDVIAMGAPSFRGGLFVRKDSNITNIDQLKGEKIAATGPFSFAGYLFLLDKLIQSGYKVPGDYSFIFLGNLDSIVFSVVNRKFKAGLIRTDALQNKIFNQVRDDLLIIDQSEKIPQFPFAVQTSMDKKRVDAIVNVLTRMSFENEPDVKVLKKLRIKSIVKASDADYDDFRKIYNKRY